MTKILIVEDDRDLVDILTFAFRRSGFDVVAAREPAQAISSFDTSRPDLIVLDLNLGRWSGFDLLKEIRRRSLVPVIILTARTGEDDEVRGLELGADDYVRKPFSHRQLIARIQAQLRRQVSQASPVAVGPITVRPITLNVGEHTVTCNGEPINLSVTEFRLLHYLMLNAGTLVPTRAVLKHVWGYDDPRGGDVVRVTVHRLRRKLEVEPEAPHLLHTITGLGVILKPGPEG